MPERSSARAWVATALEGSDLNLLPHMETDVTLRSADRTIIVECKYTESLYQKHFFSAWRVEGRGLISRKQITRLEQNGTGPHPTCDRVGSRSLLIPLSTPSSPHAVSARKASRARCMGTGSGFAGPFR